jgi:sucrose-phosphate synthase
MRSSEQYALYDYYQPDRMVVIPPGTDLVQFRPPADDDPPIRFAEEVYSDSWTTQTSH